MQTEESATGEVITKRSFKDERDREKEGMCRVEETAQKSGKCCEGG